MSKKDKSSYTRAPEIAAEVVERYRTVMEVISGTLTVSEGARRLNVSRNHFQSLIHRAMGAVVDELMPTVGGRPPMPESERKLREETERLRVENLRLKKRAEATDHMLNVASGFLKGHLSGSSRERRSSPKKPTEED